MLTEQNIDFVFWDYKKQGLPPELADWLHALGWQTLLNKGGTTWRKIDPAMQASVCDAASALTVMQSNNSVIKRPVIVWGVDTRRAGQVTVGKFW